MNKVIKKCIEEQYCALFYRFLNSKDETNEMEELYKNVNKI